MTCITLILFNLKTVVISARFSRAYSHQAFRHTCKIPSFDHMRFITTKKRQCVFYSFKNVISAVQLALHKSPMWNFSPIRSQRHTCALSCQLMHARLLQVILPVNNLAKWTLIWAVLPVLIHVGQCPTVSELEPLELPIPQPSQPLSIAWPPHQQAPLRMVECNPVEITDWNRCRRLFLLEVIWTNLGGSEYKVDKIITFSWPSRR